jgi:hypothetical protein
MAATEAGILGYTRINEIFNATQDVRQIPANLRFLGRTPKVPASDADILARWLGQAHIADIVADDQRAATYAAGRIKFETTMIPNIKLGRTMSQEDIKRLEFLASNPPNRQESLDFEAYFQNESASLLNSLDFRLESLLVGMEIDAFTYNHNGIIITLTWGMPAELKFTAAVAWTDATNSKPLTDIQNQRLIAQVKYGKVYNRVKLSTPAFRLLTQSAEFKSQMQLFFINTGQPSPQIPLQSTEQLLNLAGRLLNMNVELYDQRYPTHPNTGAAPTYSPYLPLNKVILDSSLDDGDATKKDLANGIVTESIAPNMGRNNLIGKFGAQYGPFSYVSVTPDLNPPTTTFWAVTRNMPRKKDEALTSVIDVGTVTDFITPGIIF